MPKTPYVARFACPELSVAIEGLGERVKGVHPACNSVIAIESSDFDSLVESIRDFGLLRPLEIDADGLLLDGRCRAMAAHVAGVEIADTDIIQCDTDPWVIAESNYARRHLTSGQKLGHALSQLRKERDAAADRKRQGGQKGRERKASSLVADSVTSQTSTYSMSSAKPKRSIEKVAQQHKVSRESLAIAEKVSKQAPELIKLVEEGKLTLNAAAKQASITMPKKRVAVKASVGVLPSPEISLPTRPPVKARIIYQLGKVVITLHEDHATVVLSRLRSIYPFQMQSAIDSASRAAFHKRAMAVSCVGGHSRSLGAGRRVSLETDTEASSVITGDDADCLVVPRELPRLTSGSGRVLNDA